MNRRVVTSGLLAGFLALVWTGVSQGLLPQRDDWGYKEVPAEESVLAVLEQELPETGLYLVPGHSPPDSLFRARYERGPIFRVHSLRAGAGGAPHVLGSLLALLLCPLLPAWLLGRLNATGSPGFLERAGTVASFGVVIGLASNLQLWGMELYPLNYSLFLTLNGVLMWIALGAFLAWRLRPDMKSTSATVGVSA
jgi:hypothetical protein